MEDVLGQDPGFDPVWDIVLEGSTGFSSSFAWRLTFSAQMAGSALTTDAPVGGGLH